MRSGRRSRSGTARSIATSWGRWAVGDYCLAIRGLGIEELRTAFVALEADREQVIRTLSEHNARKRSVLEDQFADLSALLPAAPRSGRT